MLYLHAHLHRRQPLSVYNPRVHDSLVCTTSDSLARFRFRAAPRTVQLYVTSASCEGGPIASDWTNSLSHMSYMLSLSTHLMYLDAEHSAAIAFTSNAAWRECALPHLDLPKRCSGLLFCFVAVWL